MPVLAILFLGLAGSRLASAATFDYGKAPVQPVVASSTFPISFTNAPLTSFGELQVAEKTLETFMMFPYGLLDGHYATFTYTGGGATTTVNGTFALSVPASANSSANLCSRKAIRYIPAVEGLCTQTAVFTQGVAGSTQTIGCVSQDWNDGWGFGFNGASFGVFRSSGGYTTWTATGSWNLDKLDGTGASGLTWNPVGTGAIYRVRYQWLGFGRQVFSIAPHGASGRFIDVHEIDYSGTQTMTSVQNPSLKLCARIQNHSSATAKTLTIPSHSAQIGGKRSNGGVHHSSSTIQASVGTTLYPVISIRNNSTFRGQTNRVSVRIKSISTSNEATNRSCEFRVIYNPTSLTNSNFQTFGGTNHSPVDVDDSATAMSGGESMVVFYASQANRAHQELTDDDIVLDPGETATVAADFDTGSGDVKAAISWVEEY